MQDLRSEMTDYYNSSSDYAKMLSRHGEEYFSHYVNYVRRFVEPPAVILDLGCGRGVSSKVLSEHGYDVIGLDLSWLFLRGTSSGRYLVADASRLPFPDSTFDAVAGFEFIEHVPAADKVLDESLRVLKPEGKIILLGPNMLSPFHCVKQCINLALKRVEPHHIFGTASFDALQKAASRIKAIRKRLASDTVTFEYVTPNLGKVGGDHDCVFLANPVEISKYLQSAGCEIISCGFGRGTASRLIATCAPNYCGSTAIAARKKGGQR